MKTQDIIDALNNAKRTYIKPSNNKIPILTKEELDLVKMYKTQPEKLTKEIKKLRND